MPLREISSLVFLPSATAAMGCRSWLSGYHLEESGSQTYSFLRESGKHKECFKKEKEEGEGKRNCRSRVFLSLSAKAPKQEGEGAFGLLLKESLRILDQNEVSTPPITSLSSMFTLDMMIIIITTTPKIMSQEHV